jgi:hypothetical protein
MRGIGPISDGFNLSQHIVPAILTRQLCKYLEGAEWGNEHLFSEVIGQAALRKGLVLILLRACNSGDS